jgi:hypothetical protein
MQLEVFGARQKSEGRGPAVAGEPLRFALQLCSTGKVPAMHPAMDTCSATSTLKPALKVQRVIHAFTAPSRPSRSCELLFDCHCASGIPGCEGTMDHWLSASSSARTTPSRSGGGTIPPPAVHWQSTLDLVHQLRVTVWLRVLGITSHLLCSSRAGVHCSACCPIFPRLVLGSGLGSMYSAASSRPMSGSMVRDAVRRMAALCQGNPLPGRRTIRGPSQLSPSC